ncbi:MAG TPA: hypothetical protein VFV61_06470 [Pyrinomonadaceae bacterium]|jgi:hypothetical protein|nr:hypothetical protein [Pyrinomonadaceae bacterium]
MMHSTNKLRFTSAAIALSLAFGIGATTNAQDQKSVVDKPSAKRVSDSGRDPFRKYEPPRPGKKSQNLVAIPSIQERIAQYRAQKAAAMSARMAAPKPTTALLLSEMQVVGISRSPRGYAAIVEATPINLSYVLYPGERFYDGQLVAIEDNRLIFRRETVFVDGRRERSVEIKSLRQPGSPTDMTTTPSSAAAPAAAESDKKSDDTSAQANKPK